MRSLLRNLFLAAGILQSGALLAAPVAQPHVTVDLLSETPTLTPGKDHYFGIHFKPEPGWHVYWRNPGDSGLPPKAEWKAEPAIGSFGPLEFPVPDRIPYGPLVNFGYDGETVILARFFIPADAKSGQEIEVVAKTKWLVCEKECVPGKADLRTKVRIAKEPSGPSNALVQIYRKKLPLQPENKERPYTVSVASAGSPATYTIILKSDSLPSGDVFFFPDAEAAIPANGPQKVIRSKGSIRVTAKQSEDRPVEQLTGVVRVGDVGYEITQTFKRTGLQDATTTAAMTAAIPGGVSAPPPSMEQFPSESASNTLSTILFFAFIGGLLLNLMPCVLPVLSIKVMGLVFQAGQGQAKIRAHGLAYAAGVLVSFWVLAAIILVLRAGGSVLGWGFQLQSPVFVGVLALLFFLMALNLLGVFEISGRFVGMGSALAAQKGYSGSFFTGVLTTVAATPCSAPFMGTALGFALTQSSATSVLVMTVLALGLAAPYLVFSFFPGASKVLPRPGEWMETLKQFLAFPLLATVVWLLSVISRQAGADGIILGLMACLFSYGIIWLLSRKAQRAIPVIAKTLLVVVLAGLTVGAFVSLGRALPPASGSHHVQGPWKPFSEETLEKALAEKKTVLVNLTADWCVTCKVNERLVLDTPDVRAALSADHVVAMVGDWTNADEAITKYMSRFGRNSVPVYLLYRRGAANPEILPQILQKSDVLRKLAD